MNTNVGNKRGTRFNQAS